MNWLFQEYLVQAYKLQLIDGTQLKGTNYLSVLKNILITDPNLVHTISLVNKLKILIK